MNGSPSAHPDPDRLAAFGLGKLEPAESVDIETHVSACEECSATLLEVREDTFVDLVRRSDAVRWVPDKDATIVNDRTLADSIDSDEKELDLPPELTDHPRYRIVELLGKGGMGDVYKAEHTLMNRVVALKLIRHDLVKHDHAVQRFRREVQTAAQLSHPNIVTAYDAEQAGDTHFLVMEYVDGTDLAEVIRQRGWLPVAEACQYIQQASDGLQKAHELQMVHRDIKPQNLIVTPDGQVKILDFGLAGIASETAVSAPRGNVSQQPTDDSAARLTLLGTIMGTPDYISPEQAEDAQTADIRSDIYGLGCTLHFLLSGAPPFPHGDVSEKIEAHLHQSPSSLGELREDVPSELEAVLTRMMAKQPSERYQTPAEVSEALAPFAQPTARSWRRRTGVMVAATLAALLVFAAIFFALPPATDPFILLIDSALDAHVYDEETRRSGLTNTDDIRIVLRDLPITTQRELINADGMDAQAIAARQPALIMIHRSGFVKIEKPFKPAELDQETKQKIIQEKYIPGFEKLREFLGAVSARTRNTKFLVYSRCWPQEGQERFVANAVERYPSLQDRLFILSVDDPEGSESFRDAHTAALTRQKVSEVLGLSVANGSNNTD